MSVSFNKAAIAAAATLAVMVLTTNAALAAVSLGYPPGRPYYGFQSERSMSRSYNNYAPSYSTPTETRQSFSYEPSESGGAGEHAASRGCCCGGQTAQPSESKDDVAANPNETRRSYSYEPEARPAPQMRTYSRRSMAVREPWQYQKTDPRRMGR